MRKLLTRRQRFKVINFCRCHLPKDLFLFIHFRKDYQDRRVTNFELKKVWRLIGRFGTFRPKGHGFESHSSRHVGTLGKSFTRSCLWCFDAKLQHSIRAVLGAPLSRSWLEEAL